MIRTFLEGLEDPNRPLLAPNYWILNKTGFILPKSTIAKTLYIILHEIVMFFVISQYIELYVIRSNLDLALTNMKISMLSSVIVFKANTFVIWQNSWKQVLKYVTEADKFERNNKDDVKVKIVKAYTKYCRRLTYFYWILVFLTCFTTALQPFVMSSSLRAGIRNGTALFPHIMSSWMPFDKELPPGCWVTVFLHSLLVTYGGVTMAAYDTSVVVVMVFFGGKLELLRERCKEMLGQSGAGISKAESDAAIKELHNIHVQLIKHSRLFNSLLSPVMFLYMAMCSFMLCAGAFQFTSSTNTIQKMIVAQYFVFGIAQLFFYCYHSNDVLTKSEDVCMGPYESQWCNATLQQRKDVLILAGQLRIHNIFSAGPFVDLTLPTFVSIMKGAYSYYTLFRG